MRSEDIESLYRICAIVNRAEDPADGIRMFADELQARFNPDYVAIALLNPDSDDIEFEFVRGSPIDVDLNGAAAPQPSTARWSALNGKPLNLSNFSGDQKFIALAPGCRAEMASPLTRNSAPIGAVTVGTTRSSEFSESDLTALSDFCSEASWVIEKLFLFENLRRQSAQLQSLISMGQHLITTRELNDLLEEFTSTAKTIMGCRVCALFLCGEDGRTIDLQTIAGADIPEGCHKPIPLDESAVGTAIERRRVIEVRNLAISEETHYIEMVRQEGLVSMLAAPIFFENQTMGVLIAYTDDRHRFSDHEKNVLRALASLSAVAIQNVRLYGRVFKSEETLRDNERLTTLGLLAAEIAHEIRNPLTVIRLLFDSLDLNFDPADPRRKDSNVIIEEITRLEGIVNRVLNFGKSGDGIHSLWDINSLVDDTLHLLRLKLDQSRIKVEVTRSEVALFIEGRKAQLQQVILNLVINSMQAMPDGGTIAITTCAEDNGDFETASVIVRDTGAGIPESLRESIFDSFLSGRSEGSGLGLSIAKRILNSHRGDIELLDSSSEGTRIRIWLPRAGSGRRH
jgi:signal transduction histidine kinase